MTENATCEKRCCFKRIGLGFLEMKKVLHKHSSAEKQPQVDEGGKTKPFICQKVSGAVLCIRPSTNQKVSFDDWNMLSSFYVYKLVKLFVKLDNLILADIMVVISCTSYHSFKT